MSKRIPLRDLIDMVSCLPSLLSLRILARQSVVTGDAPISSPLPFRLREVSLDVRQGGNAFLSWLHLLPLKSLRFSGRVSEGPHGGAMEEYFRHAGDDLESLYLHIPLRWEATKPFYLQILPHTSKLRDLTFDCDLFPDLPEIISVLPASSLTSVTVIGSFLAGTSSQELDTGSLDAVLAGSQFATLRKFSVIGISGRSGRHGT
ncbi:hypothetical protein DFH08DRAFT_821829 [Mycena albidolilacea]|uniref:Uncharacterized protein n=1 Tax=Mycena albidolilacea TaxID=1033008 RepID=A0AAD6Z944_9AGAR|nr:hypothetical protein DFH08DRAFT_821829 [Mycena albidolilacea]